MWSPILGTEQSQKPSMLLTEWEQLCREGPQGHSGQTDDKSAVQPHSEWRLMNTAQYWQEHGQQMQKMTLLSLQHSWNHTGSTAHSFGPLAQDTLRQARLQRPPRWLETEEARSAQPGEKGNTIPIFSYKMGTEGNMEPDTSWWHPKDKRPALWHREFLLGKWQKWGNVLN